MTKTWENIILETRHVVKLRGGVCLRMLCVLYERYLTKQEATMRVSTRTQKNL